MSNGSWARKAILAAALGALAALITAQAAMAHPADGRTAAFELTVEGSPPANAAYFGVIGGESTRLRDPDGDDVYTGGMFLHSRNYSPSEPLPVSIWGGIGEVPSGARPSQEFAGYPGLVIEDFGVQKVEDDETFSGGISFDEDSGAATSEEGGGFAGEFIVGTDGDDLLQGADGDDLIVGEAGMDEVNGGAGDDALYAAYDLPTELAPNAPASPDLLFGGEGDDFIDAADVRGAPDTVFCGPGADLVVADAEDFMLGSCEEILRF